MPKEQTFILRTEFITLSQLLKAAGIVSSGADAKIMLAEGGIRLNGALENRRGRKIRPGDVVTLADGHKIRIS